MKLLLLGIKPVSTNRMYRAITRRTKIGVIADIIATDELLEYKSSIKNAIRSAIQGKEPLNSNKMYELTIEVSYPRETFYYKNGQLKKKDASNTIKALEDGISEALGVDDKQNVDVKVGKYFNEDDKYIIYVELVETTENRFRGMEYYKRLIGS